MSKLRGLKYAIAALVCIAAFAMLLQVTAQPAAAAPLAGEIFIDMDGDRTYNSSVDLGLFTTIQYAIDNASSGDVVVVGSGNYSETLIIPIDISLVGANEGIDPNTGVRGNETCLIPNVYGMGPLVMLGSNFVTIDGFCINGSNPALGSFGTINGVNLTMALGIFNYGGENNFTFVNNIVSTFDTAIMLSGESRDNLIGNNLFDNIVLATTGGFAVQTVSDFYANITNNVFTRTNIAIYVSTYAAPGSSLIEGNQMSVIFDGIFMDHLGGLAATWTVNNNVIEAIGSANVGVWVQGVEGNTAKVDLTFNAISGMQDGIMLVDNPTTAGVNVIGGLIIDCNYAIYAQEGSVAFVSGDSVYTVDGVLVVNPTSYGIYINNTNSLGSTVTRVNVQNGAIILGGLNGAGVEGTGAVLAFNGAEPINFIGTTNYYIELINSPRDIDARQVLFDGLTGANMTAPQIAAAEAKIWDKVDNPALGVVMIVSAQATVTKVNDLTGDGETLDDTPIQGWTVYLWTDGVQGSAQLTDVNGTFTWSDLGPGSYMVSEDVPVGWTATSATSQDFGTAMSGGVYDFTFTNFQNVNITVTKLRDLTGNGQTVDDTPIQGWLVYLWTDGIQGAGQLTGVDGTYTWTDLGPAAYNVSELADLGWTVTSEVNHGFGTVVSGVTYSYNFTNFQDVMITVTKLNDLTGDGQTLDDLPLGGWTVYLWTDGVQGAPEQTGVDGTFTWYLGPGSYNVSELVSLGWNATSATYHNFGTVVSGGIYTFNFTNYLSFIIVNPGDSIQAAIDASSWGTRIIVLPGTYIESLDVWKPLTLLGPNAGIDPNTEVRGPEACIIPPSVDIGPLITISSSGVTIDGFCINGSNPLLGRLGVINGVNLTTGWGIFNLDGEDNLTIVNNMFSTFDTAIALSGESRDNLIGNNLFDNIDVVIGNGFAVQLGSDFFADIVKNVFTRTYTAIFASDYMVPGSALIDNNTMSVSWDGIVLSHFAPEVGVWTISNNVIEAIGSNAGITLQGLASSVVLTGDAVSAMVYGILLIDNPAPAGISISNELLINCDYGIYAQEGSIAFIDGDSNYVVDAVLIVNSSLYAIYVSDTDSISVKTTNMTVQNGTNVLGGWIGIGVEGTGAVVVFEGVDPIELTGLSDHYIALINSPRDIDATEVLFDGLIGADMTLEQNFAVEDNVTHALDVSGLGFVEWAADNAFVTAASGSVQRGIDVGMLTVYVAAGSFEEALVITNPNINLLGAGAGLTNVVAPDLGSPYWLVTIDGSTAFVQGFTFSGPATNLLGGILLINTASATFVDDDFVSLRDVANSQSVWAMQVGNAITSAYVDVSGGMFSDFAGGAIKIVDAPLGFNIFDNDVTGSGTAIGDMYGQVGIKVQSASGGLIDTIRFTNFAGSGFGACIEIDAASSGLNVMNSSFIGRGELVDNSAGIRMMGFGPVDVTLGANSFSLWNLAVVVDGSEHLTLVDNIFVDNLGAALVLHESNDTTILRGSFTSNQNGIVAQTGTANDTARDVNFEGNGIALYNQATDVFDARLNWWGHVTGPGGDAPGFGDPIVMSFDDNILYNPWLGAPFPPEVPVNGTFDILNDTHPVIFVGDELTLVVSMTGDGDHLVTLLQYLTNPNGAVYWKDAQVYFDLAIFDITGITQVEMRAYYDPLDLPDGIVESELRAYWSEDGVWNACSDSGVNLTDHYVWVLLRADTRPSLAQLTETPFMLGTPVASFAPSVGSAGSLLSALNGAGFNVNQMVTLYLEDTPIAQTMTDASGNFSIVTGFIPNVLPGVYGIRVQDASGYAVNGQFTVLDTTPIDITLDVGSLYFPGESVTWYAMFVMNGQMLDPDTIVATLYGPEALVVDLSANLSHLTTGLWTVSAIIPGSASSGEYTLVVRANISDSNFGATLRTFLISATLMDQYSLIVGIDGNIAEIQTSIGVILVDLSEISANLTAIEGSLATIQTSIGLLQVDIDLINATLAWVNGTLVTVQTTLGNIIVQLDEIYTEIEDIQGDIVFVNTTLGMVQVTVEAIHAVVLEINGTVATIETDLGPVMVNVTAINAQITSINLNLVSVQTTLGMVLVNVTAINAQVTSINNTLVTVRTDIGTLQTSVTNVNAHLTAVQNDVATVQTTVGTITVNLAALNTTVTSIQGNVATIRTSLGTLTGNVTGIEGDIATIQTNLGTMQADISGLQLSAVDNGNIGLISIVMLVMVLFILVAMYFWRLRKVI